MSKTFKDKHYKTRLKELWLQGKIEHNHQYLGTGATITPIKKYSYSEKYSTFFYKEEYNKALEYVKQLKTKKPQSDIVVEERKIIKDNYDNIFYSNDYNNFTLIDNYNNTFNINDYPGYEYDGYSKEKIIIITVYLPNNNIYYTKYCTDWDHYDPNTNTDTRDNGIVTCKPNIYQHNKNNCDCFHCMNNKFHKNIKREKELTTTLNDYKDYYNSGITIEELYNI